MSAELYEKISEKIFEQYGGRENLPLESQQIIREAVERAVSEFLDDYVRYPRDEETISWIVEGKTMTYIKILSLKKEIPILGFKVVPISSEFTRKIDPKKIKIALIQIGLPEVAYTKHDVRLGLLFQLKEPSKVSKIILEILQKEISEDVNFVCLPELSIPSVETFMGKLERLAKMRQMFIVAGSFHDLDICSNISFVITPSRERFAQHKIRASDEYAEGLKPRIFCPVKIFDADLVRFIVLICSDVMLPSVANLLTFRGMRCQGIDIVFNPSHTRALEKIHGEIRSLCNKVLAYIAFVNAEHGGSVVLVPKKISEIHPLMIADPCGPCQVYEVKIAEFSISIDSLRNFRRAHYGIRRPEECYVSPV